MTKKKPDLKLIGPVKVKTNRKTGVSMSISEKLDLTYSSKLSGVIFLEFGSQTENRGNAHGYTVSIKVQFHLLHFQKLCEQYVSPIKHSSEVCDKEIRNCKTMYHYFCICKFPYCNVAN